MKSTLAFERTPDEIIADGLRWQPLTLWELAKIAERVFAGATAEEVMRGLRKINDDWCRCVGRVGRVG